MRGFLFVFGLGLFGLVLRAVFFVERGFEFFNGFEVVDDFLVGDSVEFTVIVLVFDTSLVDIDINELAEFYFIQVQGNMFVLSLCVLMLGFLYAFDELARDFISLLK